jgi:Mg2+ and Co2+ transporter CorA
MEEAREKIELFRNYYLVCFRSFDQDPYSPTHLEPLNMYIIVFREGTLSVSGPFVFPQCFVHNLSSSTSALPHILKMSAEE